ncbi:MAG TPA: TlpA disulfide reductase family protein [Gemmatimonadales bacterium]|nr:TlpA disulfide reductase family protein [Gemmatimonadales bacterium]
MRSFVRAAALAALLAVGGAALAPAPLRAQDEGIPVGTAAPAVTINDLDGTPVDLGKVIGTRPVVLEFWATWCEICRALMPRVREAAAQYGGQVAFYGVNVTVNQTPAKVRRYLDQHHPPFITLYDAKGVGVRAYQAYTTSYVVIIDRHGKVAYTGSGADQDLGAALARVTAG